MTTTTLIRYYDEAVRVKIFEDDAKAWVFAAKTGLNNLVEIEKIEAGFIGDIIEETHEIFHFVPEMGKVIHTTRISHLKITENTEEVVWNHSETIDIGAL